MRILMVCICRGFLRLMLLMQKYQMQNDNLHFFVDAYSLVHQRNTLAENEAPKQALCLSILAYQGQIDM